MFAHYFTEPDCIIREFRNMLWTKRFDHCFKKDVEADSMIKNSKPYVLVCTYKIECSLMMLACGQKEINPGSIYPKIMHFSVPRFAIYRGRDDESSFNTTNKEMSTPKVSSYISKQLINNTFHSSEFLPVSCSLP